ncbi:MAG TPA: fibronectin type III domain-containing protein, partial [Opitutaceae bacterium]|nr:fibronectin type III domain-containing protein [Opitutaceae bacterium]
EGPDTHGVYLDDLMSSAEVVGNVFYDLSGAAIFSGGGRDNNMSNNIIAGCGMGHYDGDYARNSINNIPGDPFNLLQRLASEGIQYQTGVWATAYPTCAAIPNSWTLVQEGLWRNPQGCIFSNNAGWANTTWTYETDVSGTGVFAAYASFTNNNPSQAPLFDEPTSWDRSLRPAEITAAITGFIPIPFASIGPSIPSPSSATMAPPVQTLQSLAVAETEVDLQWSDDGYLRMQQPTGFQVQQEISGTWQVVQSFGPDVDYAAVTGLAPDTSYTFRVQATNSVGSTYSSALTVTTLMAPLVPGTPVRFEAETPLNVLKSIGTKGAVSVIIPTLVSGKAVTLFDVGDAIRIYFTAPTTGTYQIGVRIRSGDSNVPIGTTYWPDGYAFNLDGSSIALTGDPTTVSALSLSLGPTYWGTMFSGNVSLTAGSHSVDIIAKRSWAAADYLQLAPMVEP